VTGTTGVWNSPNGLMTINAHIYSSDATVKLRVGLVLVFFFNSKLLFLFSYEKIYIYF